MMRFLAIAVVLISQTALALPVTQANVRTASGNVPLTLEVATTPAARDGLNETQNTGAI